MGKATENQKSDKALREKLLKGIIDIGEQPKVSFLQIQGVNPVARFDLDRTLEELEAACIDAANQGKGVRIRTFQWSGERADKMQVFNTIVRPSSIIEVTEVTDEMWMRFVTETADRAMMAKMGANVGARVSPN